MPRRTLKVSSNNHFVTITPNNRIKVWKLELVSHTKNVFGKLLTELYEPNHLKIHYTSIAIFDDHQKNNKCLLALGDRVGRIILFDINKSSKIIEISHHTKDASKDFIHIKGGHHSRINSIKFDKFYDENNQESIQLITCSSDKKLCRWDLNGKLIQTVSIGDDIPSCLTVSHAFNTSNKKNKKKNKHKNEKFVVIGSNNINFWKLSKNTDSKNYRVGTFQGHASQVRHLELTKDNDYLISTGQGRHVYIWKCKSMYKSNKKQETVHKLKSAEYSLPLDDDVVSVDVFTTTKPINKEERNYLKQIQQKHKGKKNKKDKSVPNTKNVYYICAASKSTIFIWYFDALKQHQLKSQPNKNQNDEKHTNLKPVVEISIADDANLQNDEVDSSLSWIQHVELMNEHKLMILRGSATVPVFKQIDFVIPNDEEEKDDVNNIKFINKMVLENVTVSSDVADGSRKLDLSGNGFQNEQNVKIDQHLTVLDVADATIATPKSYDQYNDIDNNKNVKKNKKRKRENDDDDDTKTPTPPTKKQKLESNSITFQDKLYEIEKQTEEKKNKGNLMGIPTADSLASLLTQSLKANDQKMFENLLAMQNDDAMKDFEGEIIKNTLDRIPATLAIKLLEKLAEKFRISPRQSLSILRWLVPLLNSHSASFAKNLSSRKHLISVHQAIDYQIKSLLPAMKLQGRLSLLMTQMEKVNEFRQNNKSTKTIDGLKAARHKALFVHDEQQIDDEDIDLKAMINNNSQKQQQEDDDDDDDFIKI